jgi:hypothetical protein
MATCRSPPAFKDGAGVRHRPPGCSLHVTQKQQNTVYHIGLRCKSVRIVVPALPEVIPGTLLKAAYSPGIRKTKGFPIEELLKLHPAVTANEAHTA